MNETGQRKLGQLFFCRARGRRNRLAELEAALREKRPYLPH